MRVSSVLLAVAAVVSPAVAQQPTAPPVDTIAIVALHLTDGSDVTGRVVAADDTSLTLLTFAGARITVPRRSIVSWRPETGRVTAKGVRRSDASSSRLFFAPTARTLPGGSGYFTDYYIVFPTVGYGVSDRVMVSGGVSIIPGSDQLVYGAAKVGVVQTPGAAVAFGAFWATVPNESDASLGMGYAVTTLGSEDHAITLLAGLPFTTHDLAPQPLFVAGGETRIGSGSKLMVEAWKLPEEDAVPVLFGVRAFGKQLSAGFGLVYVFPNSIEGWPFIPWGDFSIVW
ncbi:MAG TPA: hypothetical protein VFO67_04860 [Gemmatimonadales bacterium]|nr:hypothetical protein [Gemmatimonadales bacterium]